jgi:hypothetical protein
MPTPQSAAAPSHTTSVKKGEPKVFLGALRTVLSSIPERSRHILEARFGITHEKPKTLEEIGKEYGITRERVRQIICSALHTLVKHHEKHAASDQIKRLIQEALEEHSGLMEAESLLRELSDDDYEERGALTAFLECLPYARSKKATHEHKKMYFLNDFSYEQWRKVKKAAYETLTRIGTSLEAKELYQKSLSTLPAGITEKVFLDYLAVSSEVQENVFGKWGLATWSDIRPRGTREKAYLVLKNSGKPLHFRKIAQMIDRVGLYSGNRKSHPQTVHNELIKDKRFVLVGRGIYALAEWGYTKGTVRDVIGDILDTAGQPLSKEAVIEAVLKVRQVKVTTIVINLNSFFHKDSHGLYSVRK